VVELIEEADSDPGSHELNRVGCKPVMFPAVGIPWIDFVVYLVIAIHIWTWYYKALPLFGLFVCFMIKLYRHDHYAGRRLLCYLKTSARCLTGQYTGGTTIHVEPGRKIFRGTLPCQPRS
jgi:hypothetical protein